MPKQNKRKKKSSSKQTKENMNLFCVGEFLLARGLPGVWLINLATPLVFSFQQASVWNGFLVKLGPGVHFPFSDLGFCLV